MAKKKEQFTVRYVGELPGAIVPGFYDGKGYYEEKGSQHTFSDPGEVQAARDLIKSNPNFEEVEE